MNTEIKVKTLDADSNFYRSTGLPESEIHDGKEALLSATFGYGYKLRAVWTTLAHQRYTFYGVDFDAHGTPPFGSNNTGFLLKIPTSYTRTSVDYGVFGGSAQAALRLSGDANLQFYIQPYLGDKNLEKKKLKFTDTSYKKVRSKLPPLSMRRGASKARDNYGFRLYDPIYEIDFTLTPELKFDFWAGYKWFYKDFTTGWMPLNSLKFKLGTVAFSKHEHTRGEYKFSGGVKRFEKIERYAGPIGDYIAIRSEYGGKYVRAGVGKDSKLAASSDHIRGWEKFYLKRLGNDVIALKSLQNGKYVRAGVGSESMLAATSDHIRSWEKFRLIKLKDGTYAFQSLQNKKYVRAGVGQGSLLAATGNRISTWEKFTLYPVEGPQIATLMSPPTYKVVTLLPTPAKDTSQTVIKKPIVFGKPAPKPASIYSVSGAIKTVKPAKPTKKVAYFTQTLRTVSIQSDYSRKYIRAGLTKGTLLGSVSASVRGWEKFQMIDLGKGVVAFKSLQNGKYIQVESGKTSFLSAVSKQIGAREKFQMIRLGGERVAFKSLYNGKYVRAGIGKNSYLGATSTKIAAWEKFNIKTL